MEPTLLANRIERSARLCVSSSHELRDGRTLAIDASGVWLHGRRVTACESVGGAVVVYTGLEPTWLRVVSMSRDTARWKREADSIAAYVQRRLRERAAGEGDARPADEDSYHHGHEEGFGGRGEESPAGSVA
jgi:hypothetical protein